MVDNGAKLYDSDEEAPAVISIDKEPLRASENDIIKHGDDLNDTETIRGSVVVQPDDDELRVKIVSNYTMPDTLPNGPKSKPDVGSLDGNDSTELQADQPNYIDRYPYDRVIN